MNILWGYTVQGFHMDMLALPSGNLQGIIWNLYLLLDCLRFGIGGLDYEKVGGHGSLHIAECYKDTIALFKAYTETLNFLYRKKGFYPIASSTISLLQLSPSLSATSPSLQLL